jgi:SAM-dependent methyltransferase
MWDERYAGEEFAYGKEPNAFLAEQAGRLAPGRVLCLAEGEGRNAVYMARLGHEVTAVDASRVGLAKAERLAAQNGVRITTLAQDLADYPIAPDSFDGVVSIFCHLPPRLRQRVHARVVSGLRPGGFLFLEAYRPAQLALATGGPPVAELMMSLAALRTELAGLVFLHGVELEREVVEGRLHTGRGAVVQVVARKPPARGGKDPGPGGFRRRTV